MARTLRNRCITLALLSVTLTACSSKNDGAADLDAINKLHQREMEAAKKFDVDTLVSLWSIDIVTLSSGEPPLIGRDANRASIERLRNESKDVQIADYILSFNEVKITGDWAYEWGTYSGTVKPIAEGETLRGRGKVLRVLKKDSDGAWRIARAMYISDIEAD
ncbi:MAG: nuclear transport factor 2 family protein [Blastocatellia bacterium]